MCEFCPAAWHAGLKHVAVARLSKISVMMLSWQKKLLVSVQSLQVPPPVKCKQFHRNALSKGIYSSSTHTRMPSKSIRLISNTGGWSPNKVKTRCSKRSNMIVSGLLSFSLSISRVLSFTCSYFHWCVTRVKRLPTNESLYTDAFNNGNEGPNFHCSCRWRQGQMCQRIRSMWCSYPSLQYQPVAWQRPLLLSFQTWVELPPQWRGSVAHRRQTARKRVWEFDHMSVIA